MPGWDWALFSRRFAKKAAPADQNQASGAIGLEDRSVPLESYLAAPATPQNQGRGWLARRRLAALVREHWDFVTRLVRHLGVWDADVEDAAQQVFLTLDAKLAAVESGRERSFLAACAVHVAARHRRARGRRREVPDEALWELPSESESPESLMQRQQQLSRLDAILGGMSEEQRDVFVLYEIEELTMAEIADALSVAPGTVASRLRRAREIFQGALAHD
jgi:RNA polymerase sigma-70 factor (ECF subfamily)